MKTGLYFRLMVFLAILFFENNLYSQDFSELDDDFNNRSWKLFVRDTHVKPGSDKAYGGVTINGSLSMDSEKKGGLRARYENPSIGDFIWGLARLVNGKKVATESGLDHAYGSGFIVWMQFYKNVVATDKFLLSPGVSFADYIFAIEQFTPTKTPVLYDPAGYFFAAGPGLMGSYALGHGMWVDGYVNYDLSFAKVKYSRSNYTPVNNYPNPHFITYGVDLNHRSGLFVGLRFNQVNDRGNVNIHALRTDISIGYHFKDND